MTHTERTSVLIVGGGYAGLASSLFLAHHGIRAILVDRHPGVSVQGRARGINQRTSEIYRPLGIDHLIADAGRPFDDDAGVARCDTLAGEWSWVYQQEAPRAWPELTAGVFHMADQNTVEPIMIDAARQRGADLRFDTELVAFHQDREGVIATVAHDGATSTIRADYLIAADGHRSPIREQLGITRQGPGITQHLASITIDADLSDVITSRAMFWIVVNENVGFGAFVATATPNRWAVSVAYDPAKESIADFTPDRCVQVARAVIGKPDVPIGIVDVAGWQQAVGVADAYRSGRVFLVGDSAHVWPPAGAMGANSAVQDAHNLAWKLALVHNGADPALLDTYEAERRPVAVELARITVARQQQRWGDNPGDDDVDDIRCTLGQRYRSTAIIGATDDHVFGPVDSRAVPGSRAPHCWLRTDDERVALHDLCHDRFVLLTGANADAWRTAADRLELRTIRFESDVDGERLGATDDTVILLRPDGYVAWRYEGGSDDPAITLADVMRRIVG